MESQPKIFISYRRHGDAAGFAMNLYKDLVDAFGKEHVFKDLSNIGPGEEFVEVFSERIASCRIFLTVIGKNWLAIGTQKRAEHDKDHVHLELRIALERRVKNKKGILVIPVLVDGAEMPGEADLPDELKGLAALNEYRLLEEYWSEGVQRLVTRLRQVLGESDKREPDVSREDAKSAAAGLPNILPEILSESKPPNFAFGVVGGGIGGLLMSAIVGRIYSMQYTNIPWWRFIIAGVIGLVVGAIGAAFIGYGILKAARLLNRSWYAKIIGGVLGGAVGGIPMIIMGGMIFYLSGRAADADPVLEAMGAGEPISPLLLAIAVVTTSFFIAIGLLAPARHQILPGVFMVACVTGGILLLTLGAIATNLQDLKTALRAGESLLSLILFFGLLPGLVAGLQVSLSLVFSVSFCKWYAGVPELKKSSS